MLFTLIIDHGTNEQFYAVLAAPGIMAIENFADQVVAQRGLSHTAITIDTHESHPTLTDEQVVVIWMAWQQFLMDKGFCDTDFTAFYNDLRTVPELVPPEFRKPSTMERPTA